MIQRLQKDLKGKDQVHHPHLPIVFSFSFFFKQISFLTEGECQMKKFWPVHSVVT